MIQLDGENGMSGSEKIHEIKEARLEDLKEFSKLPDQEKFLNNNVLPQDKNAWFWNTFRRIDEECRYFKY